MLAKHVKVGVEYAMQRYGIPASIPRRGMHERDTYTFNLHTARARVLEVGVDVGYARPGARVIVLDPQTGEPLRHKHAPDVDVIETVRYVGLVIEWDEWASIYADSLEAAEEKAAEEAAARVKRKAEAQEREARRWMERTFERARDDISDMAAIGALEGSISEEMIRALIDHRHPDGNPYLNGEREAHG